MKKEQPILGGKGTLFFLVIISAFPPLTTDLYLPALPQMVDVFSTTQAMVNLTLGGYLAMFSIGLLFWGPLSEKYGRKAILLTGLGVYIASSILCALAESIEMLILFRVAQAFGGGAVTVVATAVIKDLYDGREREKIMATVMSLVVIAPMVAPVLGAFLLKVASWRMMFVVLAIFGSVAVLGTLMFRETLDDKYTGSVLRAWGRVGVVLKNPRFSMLLAIFSIAPMSMMAFIAAASFIYIDGFGLSEQTFSFFFAFNALFATAGPMIYIRISRQIAVQKIVSYCFALILICGLAMVTAGDYSPWLFAVLVAPATLAVITLRVPGTNLMLEQQERDTGSAAALIQFTAMMLGSAGMYLVSLRPEQMILSLGTLQITVGVAGSLFWLLVRNRPFVAEKLVQTTYSGS
ncbi:multidrug effflux MFS transporter [Vibrio sp. JC009]|uniref:multidrug effflux MFS transporter n=1 Tax=Vibrio sp. JC009 TaxID=2912314 RepID=UPI0023B0C9B5|nr:multidrug effflux MFS transporter [Vibrio sp. JC009]WED23363.1 multidrug effflux MFS transporter [Vibrio sp. JC009]